MPLKNTNAVNCIKGEIHNVIVRASGACAPATRPQGLAQRSTPCRSVAGQAAGCSRARRQCSTRIYTAQPYALLR